MNDHFHEDLLSGYLDGELSPSEWALVERRLAASPDARRELAELRQVSGWLQELPSQAAPQSLSRRVLQAVQGTVQRANTPSGMPISRAGHWWTAGCSVVALVLVALLLADARKDRTGNSPGPIGEFAAVAGAGDSTTAPDRLSDTDSDESVVALSMLSADEAKLRRSGVEALEEQARLHERLDAAGAGIGGVGFGHVTNAITAWNAPAIAPIPEGIANGAHPLARAEMRSESAEQGPHFYAFNDSLPREQVGKVVSAMEQTSDRLATLTLSVANRAAGLMDLQKELGANSILPAPTPGLDTQNEADRRDADQQVAVYVEATPEQITSTLHNLRANGRFHSFRAGETIPLEELDRVTRAQLAWAQSAHAYESAMRYRYDPAWMREQQNLLQRSLDGLDGTAQARDRSELPADDEKKAKAAGRATNRREAEEDLEERARRNRLQQSAVAAALSPQAKQVVLFPSNQALKDKSASAKQDTPLLDRKPAEPSSPPQEVERQTEQATTRLVRVLLVLEDAPVADESPVQAPKP